LYFLGIFWHPSLRLFGFEKFKKQNNTTRFLIFAATKYVNLYPIISTSNYILNLQPCFIRGGEDKNKDEKNYENLFAGSKTVFSILNAKTYTKVINFIVHLFAATFML
jgi:hypothetical protein